MRNRIRALWSPLCFWRPGIDGASRQELVCRAIQLFFSFAVGLCLLAGLLLTVFAHPQVDDLERARLGRELGVVESVRYEYTHWSGRWLATGLSYALGSRFDLTAHYGLFLLAGILLLPVALYQLITAVFRDSLPLRARASCALFLFVLFWSKAPASGQIFYWLSGNIENLLTLSLSLLVLAVLIRMQMPKNWRQWIAPLCLCGAAFAIMGLHELHGLALAAALAAGLVIAQMAKLPARRLWLLVLCAAMAGFLLVALSPGNKIRSAYFPMRQNVVRTAQLTAVLAKRSIQDWALDETLLLATIVVVLDPKLLRSAPRWLSTGSASYRRIIPVSWIVILLGYFAGVSWATGQMPPGRTLSVAYFVFLIGWLLTALLFTRSPGFQQITRGSAAVRAAALALLALCLLAKNGFPAAALDLAGSAPQYDRSLRERYTLIQSSVAQGKLSLVVPRLRAHPASFWESDITEDPGYWINVVAAKYFHLTSISLEKERPQ